MDKEIPTQQPYSFSQRTPKIVLHYWGRRGGGSEFTESLARHLAGSLGCENVLLSLARQNADLGRFQASGCHIIPFDRPGVSTLWRRAWSLPRMLREHADVLAALEPDAVIVTMNAPFAWPFIGMLQRRGIKVVYVAHDAVPHPGDYAVLWQRVTQDLLIGRADRIVALSSIVARRIADRIPSARGKLSVIPLETAYPTRRPHPAAQPGDEPIRLLFYGRLLPYKGLDLLAQALAPLRSHPGWRLTIAGSGPLEGNVRRSFAGWPQVDLELGWISDDRAAELLSSHHLLLCPYQEASQSGVIAQALSWAMPSVVMPTGALPEQIAHGAAGLVAETSDAEGFRRCLVSIVERPGAIAELSRGAATLLSERQANNGWIELIRRAAGR
jgi:glycosyltransferase involved in cell wall biosynthesis